MICDVSAVASDYLASGVSALTDMAAVGGDRAFPLSLRLRLPGRWNLATCWSSCCADPLAAPRHGCALLPRRRPAGTTPGMFLAEARAVLTDQAASPQPLAG